MTGNDVNQQICPMRNSMPCKQSACMMWRWRRAKETEKFVTDCIAYMKKHDVSHSKAIHEVFKKNGTAAYTHTEGYCGLAGRPE